MGVLLKLCFLKAVCVNHLFNILQSNISLQQLAETFYLIVLWY